VIVSHHQVEAALVLPVMLGEPGVLEAVRVLLLVLLPEQLQGHALMPKLAVNAQPFR
jgi:hypothetical protein